MTKIRNIDLGEFPILLAPLEGITDRTFRKICKQFGADVVYSEFVSSEALIRDVEKSTSKMTFEEMERPVGIQIFGHNIESMVGAAKIAEELKPDIIDLNFGCPVKKVAKKGAGSAILADVPRMVAMTEAVVKATNLPVTVKTRLGIDEQSKNIVEVAEKLQDVGIEALTIHGRTKKQLYSGHADWTLIGKIKNNPRMHIPIIGNGDIKTPQQALDSKNKYGVDGIMIGRAAIGYPWIFNETKHFFETGELLPPPTIKERIEICKHQINESIHWKGEKRTLFEMRKLYSNYFKGIQNFKPYRTQLVTVNSLEEVLEVFIEIEKTFHL